MVFVEGEEFGIKGFRCELNRGEVIELTIRSLFPNLTDEDIVTLREAIDHGINNYQSSRSNLSISWERNYSSYFTDSSTEVVLEGMLEGNGTRATELIESIRGGNYVDCKTERIKPGSDQG